MYINILVHLYTVIKLLCWQVMIDSNVTKINAIVLGFILKCRTSNFVASAFHHIRFCRSVEFKSMTIYYPWKIFSMAVTKSVTCIQI